MRASRKLILALSTAENRAARARMHLRTLNEERADPAAKLQAAGEVRAWEDAVRMLEALA